MNLVVGMLLLGGGGAAVWAGLNDPAGGFFAGVRNVLGGQPNTKRTSATSAAFLASVAPGGTVPATGPGTSPTPGSGARAAVVASANTWLGVHYMYGGNTRTGVDCSGLTKAVYAKAAGINLPRIAAAQALAGHGVDAAHAQAGDLVAFGFPASHVGIYLGGGSMLHAPHTGAVVRVETVASVAASLPGSVVTYRDLLDRAQAQSNAQPHPTVMAA